MIVGEAPSPRSVGNGMVSLGGRLYVFGGAGPTGNILPTSSLPVSPFARELPLSLFLYFFVF